MKNAFKILILSSLIILIACNSARKATSDSNDKMNMLTNAEKRDGWVLLFDGKTLDGWRSYKKQTVGSDWKVQDGAIVLDVQKDANGKRIPDNGGDITAGGEFTDFELKLDWKIDKCGNSGIIYRSVEANKYNYPWQTGPEMQIVDNDCHPDAKIEKHRAGDFYDVVKSSKENVKPALEWNSIRIVAKGNHVEQWQNGEKVVDVQMGTEEWKALLKNSKWKDHPDFSLSPKGLIVLQDHGDRVWFRNIKVKKL
ncbi:MAG: DUF1080 domain-containing protein [Saprospiraceae bacterium]|nr:DUF1080 domain-containing protein [Saprospiraceae bacterium]